ncbi:copper homeostasis protein cutC [Ephemerocybe angulata]|uniref:Copper homeostasis protein cutC homolog n=1 Tax=Ephemerocybe angulata TaxID=980116 RepID=A0A8H6IJP9_9AGAR|nr:copper homeostasis protein cutC [Tulosesus angulatus]
MEVEEVIPSLLIEIMVRPRVGDFRYTSQEIEVMLEDIAYFKELGVRGFVVGVLTEQGSVDIDIMKRLVDRILPLEVCFHRAFDMTKDPVQALEDIIEIGGISRLLTSGHGKSVPESLGTLELLFKTAKRLQGDAVWGLTIMPGGGVNRNSITTIVQQLLPRGLREIHLSGGRWNNSAMQFKREGMGFGASVEREWAVWATSKKEVYRVREAADFAWDEYWDGISESESEEADPNPPSNA